MSDSSDFIVAAPASVTREAAWIKKKGEIEDLVEKFWKQFAPGIIFDGVEVIPTGKLTLAGIQEQHVTQAVASAL